MKGRRACHRTWSPPRRSRHHRADRPPRRRRPSRTTRSGSRRAATGSGVPASSAISALGGIAYLADFAIGANIGISYGTVNALWGILVFAVVIFLIGLPAGLLRRPLQPRPGPDHPRQRLRLLRLGGHERHLRDVHVHLLRARGLDHGPGPAAGLGIPLWIGYAVSTSIIFPLVVYGMRLLSKLQLWTTPLWLVLMVLPFAYLLISHPESVTTFFAYQGEKGQGGLSLGSIFARRRRVPLAHRADRRADRLPALHAAADAGELAPLVDRDDARRARLGASSVRSSRSIGLFLAVYLIANVAGGAGIANEPVHQFLGDLPDIMPAWLAMTLAVVLVVISQIKINVTNAYSGSLAWTNSFTRVTKHYPGRLVFLGVNLAIALVLMEANMFDFLNTILGFYANCGMAWVVVVASDIAINKYLLEDLAEAAGVPPRHALRGQPGRVRLDDGLGGRVDPGVLRGLRRQARSRTRRWSRSCSRSSCRRCIALATKGKYYLRRTDDGIDAADVRRARQPVGGDAALPRLPAGLRAPRHGGLRGRARRRSSARCACRPTARAPTSSRSPRRRHSLSPTCACVPVS